MNNFLLQVNMKGYSTIKDGSYSNEHWEKRARGDQSRECEKKCEHPYNRDHGMVEPGDRLVVYCTSTVPDETHKKRLAFSVIVNSVSDDRTRFEIGDPQDFQNPLKFDDIRRYKEQGKLDECFKYCGQEGFNITKLEPTAVKQLSDLVPDLVELQNPPLSAPTTNRLVPGWRAVRAAVRHLRGRFQRRDRGGEA